MLLESPWDLKGLDLRSERIAFADTDNFKRKDFSYARFYDVTFERARFYNVTIEHATIRNCKFINCVFAFTSFYGVTLEKTQFVNCDFVEGDSITNCDLKGTRFDNCFLPNPLFFDCKFDELTIVDQLKTNANRGWMETLDNKESAEIYKGIKEAFRAGQVVNQAQNYFLKERQAVTRYIRSRARDKLFGYFLEFTAGYGIRPSRVLLTMIVSLIAFSSPFMMEFGISDGFLIGAGAFFTFGANSDKLKMLGYGYRFLYIIEAFIGLSLIALFVTVLANKWFSEK